MTKDLSVTLEEAPDPADAQKIQTALREFNQTKVGDEDHHKELAVLVRDREGKLVAGLLGGTFWGWLYVSTLWVEERLRGQGIGGAMLDAAETEAVRRGCTRVTLDTMSFQARGFYEKRGYEVLGTLEDMPAGHSRYFMRKQLA